MKTRLRKRTSMNPSECPVVVLSDSESEFQGFLVHTVDESDIEVVTLDDSNTNQSKVCSTVDETPDFIPVDMSELPRPFTRGRRRRYFDASPDVIVLKKRKRLTEDVITFSKRNVEKCDRITRKTKTKVVCQFKKFKKKVTTKIVPKFKRFQNKAIKQKTPQIQLSHSNIYCATATPHPTGGLRPVIIDGCNVAFRFGNGKFEIEGIILVVELFKARGHKEIVCFLPQCHQGKSRPEDIDKQIKNYERENTIIYTPSRKLNGKLITPYDDRFIVQYASERGGVIVSNDGYLDLINEESSWRTTIEQRIINFTFARGLLMLPKDPLGPNGPTLDEMLRFPVT